MEEQPVKSGNSKTIIIASAALSIMMVLGSLFGSWLIARNVQPAAAQTDTLTPKTEDGKPSQVTVVGTGTVNVKPDVLKITIGVMEQENTVKAAQAKVDTVLAAMIQVLKNAGIADADYVTSQYNVEAALDYSDPKNPSGTLIGYRVTSLYEITFRDTTKAAGVIDALTNAGANTVYGTYYAVSNADELTKQAYDGALKDAQERAAKISGLSNLTLGKIVSVSEVTDASYTLPMRGDGMGGGGGYYAPGQQTIISTLIVTYEAASK